MDRRTPQQILAPTPNNQSRSFSAGHRPPSAALSSSSNSCLGTSHAINMQPRQSQPQLPNACDLLVLADAVLHSQNNCIRLRAANSTMTTAATHQVGPVSKPFQHAELSREGTHGCTAGPAARSSRSVREASAALFSGSCDMYLLMHTRTAGVLHGLWSCFCLRTAREWHLHKSVFEVFEATQISTSTAEKERPSSQSSSSSSSLQKQDKMLFIAGAAVVFVVVALLAIVALSVLVVLISLSLTPQLWQIEMVVMMKVVVNVVVVRHSEVSTSRRGEGSGLCQGFAADN